MALLLPTQLELVKQAHILAGTAEARLAMHRKTGATKINVTAGKKVDYYVNLLDSAGAPASAIEYGRKRGRGGGSKGIYALTKSALFGRTGL